MSREPNDARFEDSIPRHYEQHMVPLLFAPFAEDLVTRLLAAPCGRVLEVAAGTGAVTREMARRLPPEVTIVATDLNPAMLERAEAVGTARDVAWRPADAMQLPFGDGSFDTVVCQFGVMFFPDRVHAYREVHRVLAPGGRFLFNTWESVEANPLTAAIEGAVAALFPNDPPRFMQRTPHGYFDAKRVVADLEAAGFGSAIDVTPVALPSTVGSARLAAQALCEGTPLRKEIEARGSLAAAVDAAEAAVREAFGDGRVTATSRALVVSARR
ncbi:MAG: class I SAM-dependent methyltransferase [Archangiaceae bacterium]|nr:class I SAM-dependent methyltransferase [Archangiaceae bacterium]